MGLVIGLMLINQVTFRERTDYEPNKGNCYSCARCMDYCPVGKTNGLAPQYHDQKTKT